MFKNLNKVVVMAGALSCFMHAAQAHEDITTYSDGEFDDVVFVGDVDDVFTDVACGADDRFILYKLHNNEPSPITLYDVRLIPNEEDNSNIKTIITTTNADTCITRYDSINGGYGVIDPNMTCNLVVRVTPPNCPATPGSGPIHKNIDQTLFIGVDTQQGKLTERIRAEVTVIGAGRDFAVLDINSDPTNNDTFGNSQLFGNLGVVNSSDGFEVHGHVYFDAANPVVKAAQSDFSSAYQTLVDVYNTNGCWPHGDIDNGDKIKSGYYCLSETFNSNPVDITLSGTIHLSGPGNFVFFIDPIPECNGGNRMCDLLVTSTTQFRYSDGASPENLYWISQDDKTTSTSNNILLANNSTLDGAILTSAGQIMADTTGYSSALVNGSLWSNLGDISLAGTTVNADVD